ncbi:MAG: hypothetical protein SF097_27800 [Acidobacteriota bacterium]|nr:hypothetical protein [Acidobacteriota bacterium]
MNDAALAALQRSLSEYREAKRKIQLKLADLEMESASLRSQLAELDEMIERNETALLRMLLPADKQLHQPRAQNFSFDPKPTTYSAAADFGDFRSSVEQDIEAEVAKLEQSEKNSNVRFTDFRIPQAATIVLREADGPLHVSEIYRRMAAGGFEFRGQHQLITLAVSLSRSKRFRKVAPGTFDLIPEQLAGAA